MLAFHNSHSTYYPFALCEELPGAIQASCISKEKISNDAHPLNADFLLRIQVHTQQACEIMPTLRLPKWDSYCFLL